MPSPHVAATALLIAVGALGGTLAAGAHLPMPWLTGSLLATGAMVRLAPARLPEGYSFPMAFRLPFIAIIGLTIGLQVNSGLISQLPKLVLSLAALTLFVPLAQMGNYLIFRRLGQFDRPTAFFAGAPGGLMESLLMGERNGADPARLTLQQFLRITLVITTVPAAMSIWAGRPLGSAAGLSSQMPQSAWPLPETIGILIIAGAIGLFIGLKGRIPAGQLTGPMAVAAVLNFLPMAPVAVPFWALIVAQVVIGASLGARFFGLSRDMVARASGLALISVVFMLLLGLLLSWAVVRATGIGFDVMLISFAPGGVTEMGLIAISLAASPAVVAFHHIYRIVLTVLMMGTMARWMRITPPPTSPSG